MNQHRRISIHRTLDSYTETYRIGCIKFEQLFPKFVNWKFIRLRFECSHFKADINTQAQLTLLSLSNSFLNHSKSLYLRRTLDSFTLNTGRLV